MGQYFRACIKQNGNLKIYSFLGHAKLTEHSWCSNGSINVLCQQIYNSSAAIAWVGDYADDFPLYREVWPVSDYLDVSEDAADALLGNKQANLNGKYLVNLTKAEYVDFDEYFEKSSMSYGCLHPLPILTCVGNGEGGGDYYGKRGKKFVGTWCFDEIMLSDKKPARGLGYKKIHPVFID